MYLPPHFAETRPEQLHRIINDHPLGMMVTHTAAGLEAQHIPFLLDPAQGAQGVLLAHVARANTVWQEVANGDAVMVVFRGVEGYVSPNWYPSKHETHRAVPTWNYEVVHAHGTVHVHDDEKFLRGLVARLTRVHEAPQPVPWKMGDAPPDYLSDMLGKIVGLEVRITRLDGKRKLSQNHEARNRAGVIQGLEARGNPGLAQAMRDASDGR
jgi:transcriptional regulator